MACCERCFSDCWLKQYFRENSTERGDCPCCVSTRARLLPLASLAPHFTAMLGSYHELTPDTILDDEIRSPSAGPASKPMERPSPERLSVRLRREASRRLQMVGPSAATPTLSSPSESPETPSEGTATPYSARNAGDWRFRMITLAVSQARGPMSL